MVVCWILRMLLRAGALDELAHAGRWPNGDLSSALGLSESDRQRSVRSMRKRLKRRLDDLERRPPRPDKPVARNVRRLGKRLGLGALECELLTFATLTQVEDALGACLGRSFGAPRVGVATVCKRIAAALGRRPSEVRAALRPGAPLFASRLVRLKESGLGWFEPVLQTLDELTPLLFLEHASVDTLLAAFFRESDAAEHTLDEFPHLAADLTLVVPFLRSAMSNRRVGVNVLVHGPPGTGKTELARALARDVGAALYEVNAADADGEPTTARARLASYALCQRVLEGAERTLVLFDEIEDVFPRDSAWSCDQSTATGSHKGWLTRMLERNQVPAIWISNDVGHIDRAIVRRFDLVVPVRVPPERVRAAVLEKHTAGLGVGAGWVERAARDERLRPGHVQRACRVVGALDHQDPAATEAALDHVLERALSTEGLRRSRRPGGSDPCDYSPDLLNASVAPRELVAGLARRRRGTVCLYGPPGTGKTAFAAHAARELDVPLVVRKASDLVSCWVGQTERNLAEMFAAATDEAALLMLDEADSFLQDRRRAHRTWEITEVNELLVQMEQFDGIFFCATNLLDALDEAALRRFDVKVRFEPLRPGQRWHMLLSTVASMGGAPDADEDGRLRRRLDRLGALTPGDFAAVARRARILGLETSATTLVAELEVEVAHKPGSGRRVLGLRAERAVD